MSLGTENEERAHAEILALHDLVCADIAFFKRQQWQASYYGLLLFAAIVALPKVTAQPLGHGGYIVLWIVSVAVLVAGLYVLWELEKALRKRRDLIPYARSHFTAKALEAYGSGEKKDALKEADDKVSLNPVFMATYVMGFGLTTWVLWIGYGST